MRKKIYAILLAVSMAGSLAAGCMSAFAAETEIGTAAEAAVAETQAEEIAETEAEAAETEPAGMAPASVTGDTSWEAQYPAIEAQVEQQLTTLSQFSMAEIEQMIIANNRKINLSVMDIAESMEDSSVLTEHDDADMASVKMLRNWYSVMDSCGQFQGVESYTADMTDNVLTLDLDTKYELAEKNDSKIGVQFIYDLQKGISLMRWEVTDSFQASIKKAALNTLIGLGTVFVVLLFLSFIISQIHWIPDLMNRKKKEQEAAKAASEVSAPAPVRAAEPAPAPEVEETDDLELVAVITAAIAASGQAPADGFVVRSIRRRGRKSNWRA